MSRTEKKVEPFPSSERKRRESPCEIVPPPYPGSSGSSCYWSVITHSPRPGDMVCSVSVWRRPSGAAWLTCSIRSGTIPDKVIFGKKKTRACPVNIACITFPDHSTCTLKKTGHGCSERIAGGSQLPRIVLCPCPAPFRVFARPGLRSSLTRKALLPHVPDTP